MALVLLDKKELLSDQLISVIVPCYNQAHFLAGALASVRAQVYSHWECIIVNDGSSDNTAGVAANFVAGDSRIRLISQPNGGLATARNRGLLEARGELVHFLDADDYILPEMYSKMVGVFKKRSDVSVVYCGHQSVNARGVPFRSFPVFPEPIDVFHDLLERNLWPCPCAVMVRRTAIELIGAFDEALSACADWDLWLRIASMGVKCVPVNGEFACYRRLSDSMSSDGWHMLRVGFAVIEKNSHLHKSCRLCEGAVIRGRRRWCRYCWVRVRPALGTSIVGKLLGYLALFARIVRTDVRLACWMGSILFRKLIRLPAFGGTKSSL